MSTSPLRAGPSPRGFATGLYLEHLEEASFLYDQRLALLDDPELTWRDLQPFEERFEAHIDALVVGGELALEVCLQQAHAGDAGECHAAVRVVCRHGRWEAFAGVIDAIESDDNERWDAIRRALAHEAPATWTAQLGKLAVTGGPAGAAAAVAIGYRRFAAGDAILAALSSADPPQEVLWALGRLGHRPALSALLGAPLRNPGWALAQEAALAGLRMGEGSLIPFALAQPPAWPPLVAGLGGGPTVARRLFERAGQSAPTGEHLLALGLVGDAGAVPLVLYHLRDAELAEAAALALYFITGAELFEEVALTPVEAEPFAEENDDELPAADAAPPAPVVVRRLVVDPQTWTAWWDENRTQFRDGTRYRLGRPAEPQALIAMLQSDVLPRKARQLAGDELAIRYACVVPFESDMFVVEQESAIRRIEEWAGAGAFQPGAWYLGGRRVTV